MPSVTGGEIDHFCSPLIQARMSFGDVSTIRRKFRLTTPALHP